MRRSISFLKHWMVPEGIREPTFREGRETLGDRGPLPCCQQWHVASSLEEPRTPVLLRRGVSEVLGDVGDDDAGSGEQGCFHAERGLVMQDKFPPMSNDKLGQNYS